MCSSDLFAHERVTLAPANGQGNIRQRGDASKCLGDATKLNERVGVHSLFLAQPLVPLLADFRRVFLRHAFERVDQFHAFGTLVLDDFVQQHLH